MYELLKLFVIGLSFWIATLSTLLHINVALTRIVGAIREQPVNYKVFFNVLAFYWTLFLISCLI